MELILGLPPMSQYDAAATPMWECFTASPVLTAYQAKRAAYDLKEMNKDHTVIARRSAEFNLAVMDASGPGIQPGDLENGKGAEQ